MPRKPRVEIDGGVYHVYNRVASGEALFSNPEEAARLVELIRKVKERDGWTVFAWCVMPNHFHLCLRTSSVPLARGMHSIKNRFSRAFNRRHGRTGGLWQSRYQAKLVDEGMYLSQVILYVHLNPVRGGLGDHPAGYRLSGHRELVKKTTSSLVDQNALLLAFDEEPPVARRLYLASIRAGLADAEGADDDNRSGDFRVLSWKQESGADSRDNLDTEDKTDEFERPLLTAAEFIAIACECLGTEAERLASRVRDRVTAQNRRLVAALGVERWSQRSGELAASLGKNPEVVGHWVGQGVRRRMEDAAFARAIDELDHELAARLRQEV
jgi:REP element-mobilizing transposase RayT